MAFIPRLPLTIQRDILAKILGRTALNDVNVGSTLHTLVNAIATELSSMESRMFQMRRSFAIQNAFGSDLDARIAELPPNGIERITETFSSGSVLRVTRPDAVAQLIVEAGATFQNPTTGINYQTTEDIIFDVGELNKEDVFVVATTPGEDGNCPTDAISIVVNSGTDVDLTCTNTRPLTNGISEESDASLQNRALRYLKSLNRTTPDAAEFLGTTFRSTQNTVFTFSSLYEDNTKPGYAELVVDDGTGTRNQDRAGALIVGTAPEGGVNYISHDFPALEPLTVANINLFDNLGNPVVIRETDFVSIPERGIVYFEPGIILGSYTWNISDYRVYTGAMAELQAEIEGNTSQGNILSGFRSAGCRIRVVYPEVQSIDFVCRVIVDQQYDTDIVLESVAQGIIAYVNNLDIGEPLRVADMTREIMTTQNVLSCAFFRGNQPLQDQFTTSGKEVIRIERTNIDVENTL